MPDLTGLTAKEAQKILEENTLTAEVVGGGETVTGQIPAAGRTVPGGSQVLLYFGEIPERETVAVPDFLGMNRRQAADAAGQLGLYILVKGNQEISPNVTVTAQSVPKETPVERGSTIELEFTDTQAVD